MAKYHAQVGDAIKFMRSANRKSKESMHTGVVTWIASSGKFLTVYPHDVIINNYDGSPLDMAISVDSLNIIGPA